MLEDASQSGASYQRSVNKFEGKFHEVLWKLIPFSQQYVAQLISEEARRVAGEVGQSGENMKSPITPQAIRAHWNARHWKTPESILDAKSSYCIQLYPHINQILDVVVKEKPGEESRELLAFVRYRLLKEAFTLSLYSPYPSESRFEKLLNWVYFPDQEDLARRKDAERAVFILCFNNDYYLFRTFSVAFERVLVNPVHARYLWESVPRLATVTTLFSDYHSAAGLCKMASKAIRKASNNNDFGLRLLDLELECIRLDAECQIQVPSDLSICDPIRNFLQRLRELQREFAGKEDLKERIASLLRMTYAVYFRALVRTILSLRNQNPDYTLPSNLEILLGEYLTLAEEQRKIWDEKIVSSCPPTVRQEWFVHSTIHYVGFDFDTIARAYSCLMPEVIVSKAHSDQQQRGVKACTIAKYVERTQYEIVKAQTQAKMCLEIAKTLL